MFTPYYPSISTIKLIQGYIDEKLGTLELPEFDTWELPSFHP
jgi:hypothetical protein